MAHILVIDDEKSIRNTLKDVLEYEKHNVEVAENGPDGLAMLEKTEFDLVLCDIKMPQMDGLEVLEKIFTKTEDTQVIMISGHGNIDTAVEAIKKGAYDFIEKPLDLNRLLITIKNALDKTKLITETKVLKKKISKGYEIIGQSKSLTQLLAMVDKVAPTEARVLITGPNGSGKELIARRIHDNSNRRLAPFVEVNCAAIPSELIESELFGHEKGSFTSAIKDRKGKFEVAEGGTLFLDEIGDMSNDAQSKVLRALQENKITRVGGEKEIKVNVRIIAATNKDLKEAIALGRFREDLYHRLSVILVQVPSLNDRAEDIPLIADYFNQNLCSDYGIPAKTISPDAITELKKINWTGNIRELRNVIERLVILCDKEITAKDIIEFAQPISK
jgi:two-component system nitrogen regulation response regulator NtrX